MLKVERLNFFDTIFPKPVSKSWYEIEKEKEQIFDEMISEFTFDERVIAYTHPFYVNYPIMLDRNQRKINNIKTIKSIAQTRRNIISHANYEIWSYDVWSEKWCADERRYRGYVGRQLAFRIKDEVIAVTYDLENIYTDYISFPAMCIAYIDKHGNRLPYTIRNKFIEQGLGLLSHGEYRLFGKPKPSELCFASMKTTLPKIIKHLRETLK